jgi:Bifunctional DNA primase/polymerase, N-terminal
MSFLDIALPPAGRGFQVFPLIPGTKRPIAMPEDYDHFDAASTEPAAIEAWSKQAPNANVGIIPDEIFCYLESDDEAALKEACKDLPPEIWDTARVSARDNRCYFIYRQTSRTKRAGNMTATREGKDNLFEFKQHRLYVVGPGSIHPKTGKPYGVEWRTIPAMPDVLLNRLCELYGQPKVTGARVMDAETKRQTGLLDRFLAHYEVATLGDWFNNGKSWYRPIECPWQDQHENPNQGTSTCIVFTEGAGYGFDCKHRCASKDWKAFRAELEARTDKPRFSFTEHTGRVTFGGGSRSDAESCTPAPKERKRPVYPNEAWEGTVVAEFAKLCTNDNNIPPKMFAEAFRCVLGAVMGDRVAGKDILGGVVRTHTILIAPKGKGKGSSVNQAARFFSEAIRGSTTSGVRTGIIVNGKASGLLSGARDFRWKPKGIGAWMAAASSVPGMARLTQDSKATIKNSPAMAWGGTVPRIISVHEELKTFLSTLFIEGGVGSGMEGIVCQLWDDVSFSGTATGTRDAVYGEMMFSLLGAVTEEDWFDLLGRGNAVGGGLMSRLNIIGTAGEYENVSKIRPPDFQQLQETFLPRVLQLEDMHVRIPSTEAADSIIGEWFDGLPDGSERLNIHAWRSAILLSWLRHESAITEKTALAAVALGQYQVASHEYYQPRSADTPLAKCQAKIMRVLAMQGPMTKRELQRKTSASRDGTALWGSALDGLVREGMVKQANGILYDAQ